uniref:Uncharacterized protein n=1 Tax=Rhizophora mucronata TaxID=61149 RepID=A0A2P2PGE7_RHIMU
MKQGYKTEEGSLI